MLSGSPRIQRRLSRTNGSSFAPNAGAAHRPKDEKSIRNQRWSLSLSVRRTVYGSPQRSPPII
jgi:hypothetical protein